MIMMVATILAGCGGGSSSTPSVVGNLQSPAVDDSTGTAEDSLAPAGAVRTMGKVVAARFADLSFETALPIERVLIKNGQQVRRGQVLAQLDQFRLRNAIAQQQRVVEQAQLQIEQAQLQMQDVIIAQGYDPDKMAQVPATVAHNADVKSGYALAKSKFATANSQLAAAQHELRSGMLTAPFDGVIANVAMQAHQLARAGEVVCRVIATDNMAVEFRVMETDLSKYKIGTRVVVVPVADNTTCYEATVSEINPVVNDQGAVTLRARLSCAQGLFDGMNVEVILK